MHQYNIDFSYLSPPSQVYNVVHSPEYIYNGEGKTGTRKIFYNVPFTSFETDMINKFSQYLADNHFELPDDWDEQTALRYAYSEQFDWPKCAEKLKKYVDWKKIYNQRYLDSVEQGLLSQGAVYSYGRDKQWRPLIFIDIDKLDLDKIQPNQLGNAIAYLLQSYRENAFIPGKVENWIIFIDTHDKFVGSLPTNVLQVIIQTVGSYFSSTLHGLYIMDASFSLRACMSIIEGFLAKETARKIKVIGKSDYKKLHEIINADQLEVKYGGTLQDLTQYWPPKITFEKDAHSSVHQSFSDQDFFNQSGGLQAHNDHQNIYNQRNQQGNTFSSPYKGHANDQQNRGEFEAYNPSSYEKQRNQGLSQSTQLRQSSSQPRMFSPSVSVNPLTQSYSGNNSSSNYQDDFSHGRHTLNIANHRFNQSSDKNSIFSPMRRREDETDIMVVRNSAINQQTMEYNKHKNSPSKQQKVFNQPPPDFYDEEFGNDQQFQQQSQFQRQQMKVSNSRHTEQPKYSNSQSHFSGGHSGTQNRQQRAQVSVGIPDDTNYDFNQGQLVDLVSDESQQLGGEQRALLDQRVTMPTNYSQFVQQVTSTPEGKSSLAALRDSQNFGDSNYQRQTVGGGSLISNSRMSVRKSQGGVPRSKSRTDRHLLKSKATPPEQKKGWTIPKQADESDDEDDDGRGIFCGICVSKRSKKPKKNNV